MSEDERVHRLERSLRRYAVYVGAWNALFWMPVFFLYFGSRIATAQVFALEAVYYFSVVALEVPTGVISDRYGRRRVLALSAACMCGGAAVIAAGQTFGVLALGQVMLACGMASASGSDTALHLDTLQALGRADEYGAREARLSRVALIAAAAAALVGGGLGGWTLWSAYAASAAAAGVALVAALGLVEPDSEAGATGASRGDVRRAAAMARTPALAWLFGVAVAATVLNHLPYELYQPYIERVLGPAAEAPAAPVAGLHMMLAMAGGAWVAGYSDRLRVRWGARPVLWLTLALQVLLVGVMAVVTHPAVVGLLVLRGVPRGLQTAPMNAEVAPRVPRELRATYLSLQSLAGRMMFGLTLLGLWAVASAAADALRATAAAGAVVGAVALVALAPGLRRGVAASTER